MRMLILLEDAASEQLWVFARKRKKFIEMPKVAECYLIITNVQNKDEKGICFEYTFPLNYLAEKEQVVILNSNI